MVIGLGEGNRANGQGHWAEPEHRSYFEVIELMVLFWGHTANGFSVEGQGHWANVQGHRSGSEQTNPHYCNLKTFYFAPSWVFFRASDMAIDWLYRLSVNWSSKSFNCLVDYLNSGAYKFVYYYYFLYYYWGFTWICICIYCTLKATGPIYMLQICFKSNKI